MRFFYLLYMLMQMARLAVKKLGLNLYIHPKYVYESSEGTGETVQKRSRV